MSDTPYACWAISAVQPEHVVRKFEDADRENAALREDKQRLFYLSERWNPKNDFRNDEIGKWIVIGDHNRMIAAIDAARKEAKR
jgi:hypothetical protein